MAKLSNGSLKSPLAVNKRRGQKMDTVKPNPPQKGNAKPISK